MNYLLPPVLRLLYFDTRVLNSLTLRKFKIFIQEFSVGFKWVYFKNPR